MTTLTQHTNLIEQATKIVNRKTLYAAGAGLIPFPIIDAATLLGVQLTMIQSIGNLYNIPFKKHQVKSLISSLIGSGGTVGLIKLFPGLGTVLGGTTTAVAGAAATYALGRVFTQHFDQGGTLLSFDPIASRAYFQKEFEAGKLYVDQQSGEIQNKTLKQNPSKKNNSSRTIKELLLEETDELQKEIIRLQKDIDTLHKNQNNKKSSFGTVATTNNPIAYMDIGVDFTIIEGIDTTIANLIKKGGIYSMTTLSKTSETELKNILKETGRKIKSADLNTWLQQASLAAMGEMQKLAILQKEIRGRKNKSKN